MDSLQWLLTTFFPISAATCSVMAAQITKHIICTLKGQKTLKTNKILMAGNMPSTHCALVTALTIAVGIDSGISSNLFAVTLILSSIVIYDATNVRYAVFLHAKRLNILSKKHPETLQKLNEDIGHTLTETVVGCIIGVCVALLLAIAIGKIG